MVEIVRVWWILAALGLVAVSLPVHGDEGVECDPTPIGRCGAFQREQVWFAYFKTPDGLKPATEPVRDVLEIPSPNQVLGYSNLALGYVYRPALQGAVDDPAGVSPAPILWRETNTVAGLQRASFDVGVFTWFAECYPPSWLGPMNVVHRQADQMLA